MLARSLFTLATTFDLLPRENIGRLFSLRPTTRSVGRRSFIRVIVGCSVLLLLFLFSPLEPLYLLLPRHCHRYRLLHRRTYRYCRLLELAIWRTPRFAIAYDAYALHAAILKESEPVIPQAHIEFPKFYIYIYIHRRRLREEREGRLPNNLDFCPSERPSQVKFSRDVKCTSKKIDRS